MLGQQIERVLKWADGDLIIEICLRTNSRLLVARGRGLGRQFQ
jgi:hypothetical protein